MLLRLGIIAFVVGTLSTAAVAASTCAHSVSARDAERIYSARVKEDPLLSLIVSDDGKYLHVSQSVRPAVHTHGNTETVTVTDGGGHPEMQIDKCSGEVHVSYSR